MLPKQPQREVEIEKTIPSATTDTKRSQVASNITVDVTSKSQKQTPNTSTNHIFLQILDKLEKMDCRITILERAQGEMQKIRNG